MSDIKAEWTNKDNFSIETTVSDYIKRKDAYNYIDEHLEEVFIGQTIADAMKQIISKVTSADVVSREDYESMERTVDLLNKALQKSVEVVRCKDCKHRYHDKEREIYYCEMYYGMGDVSDANYCSYGERKDDND